MPWGQGCWFLLCPSQWDLLPFWLPVSLQSFGCLHQSVLRCSWPGKGQKLFSPCTGRADTDKGNAWIASSSREVCNTSASSVCRFHSASDTEPCFGGWRLHLKELGNPCVRGRDCQASLTVVFGKQGVWGGKFFIGSSKSTSLNTGKKECCPNPLTPSRFPASHSVWLVCLGIARQGKLVASPSDHLF